MELFLHRHHQIPSVLIEQFLACKAGIVEKKDGDS